MGFFRWDYWTKRLALVMAILLLFSGWLFLQEPRDYLIWLALSYLIAVWIHPYFKKYFFRKAVIFDYVGV
ncbi:MAG: hypothetical protein ABH863_00655, partial [Candidatus Micrarchaeota archaeon]